MKTEPTRRGGIPSPTRKNLYESLATHESFIIPEGSKRYVRVVGGRRLEQADALDGPWEAIAPNCRACNDTGMLHDPHQPCRMCDAYQRQAEQHAYGYVALSRPVPVASISFDYARNRIQVADEDGEVLAVAQPFLVPDHRPESARRFDDEPPSEWQELARYLAVGLVIFAIGCAVTVWGLM